MITISDATHRPVAEKVLEMVKALVDIRNATAKTEIEGWLAIEIYENGRERGYSFTYRERNGDNDRTVAFGEFRSSDDIVVYHGLKSEFEYNTNVPSDPVYRRKKFFANGEVVKAATYAYDYLFDGKVG